MELVVEYSDEISRLVKARHPCRPSFHSFVLSFLFLPTYQKGDVSNTAGFFLSKSRKAAVQAQVTPVLTLKQVDDFLTRLSVSSGNDEQEAILREVSAEC